MDVINAEIQSFRYATSDREVLKDLRLEVAAGEMLVLTGNSGCGKTTLLRVLNGLIPEQYEGELKGRVRLLGRDIGDFPPGALAKILGNVFQNPSDQFFTRQAEDEVALVGENLGMPQQKLRDRVRKAFQRLNIDHLRSKNLSELSGGEKQKVAIASTLVYDTKILFFDEPSASLDQEGIRDLRQILKDLKAQGKTLILAEHRLYFLRDLYDRVCVMEDGKIAKTFAKGELATKDCRQWGLRAIDFHDLSLENKDPLGPRVATVQNLAVQRRHRTLISDLSFELREHEIMGVVGKNGSGKSTLARVLCGLMGGRQEISWGRWPRQRLRQAYYMMQDVDYLLFFDTVENELLAKHRGGNPEVLQRVAFMLRQIDLWDLRLEHPQNLSGGQKQRLALANAFLSEKNILLLDEPTSGLDHRHMEQIADLIRRFSTGRPVILIGDL